MATINDTLAVDSTISTGLTNFKGSFWNIGGAHQKGVSYAMSQFGFVQTNDGGQVQWADSATATITTISGNGTIWSATTSAAHGFRPGQVITIANTVDFNGNFVLATASGSSFTITNATNNGTTDSAGGQTGIIKGLTKVPDIIASNNTTLQSTSNAVLNFAWKGIWLVGTTYAQ